MINVLIRDFSVLCCKIRPIIDIELPTSFFFPRPESDSVSFSNFSWRLDSISCSVRSSTCLNVFTWWLGSSNGAPFKCGCFFYGDLFSNSPWMMKDGPPFFLYCRIIMANLLLSSEIMRSYLISWRLSKSKIWQRSDSSRHTAASGLALLSLLSMKSIWCTAFYLYLFKF